MPICFGSIPGHHRNTTAMQRAVLYTIVIILVTAFTIFLNRTWNTLQKEYNLETAVLEGYSW